MSAEKIDLKDGDEVTVVLRGKVDTEPLKYGESGFRLLSGDRLPDLRRRYNIIRWGMAALVLVEKIELDYLVGSLVKAADGETYVRLANGGYDDAARWRRLSDAVVFYDRVVPRPLRRYVVEGE